MRRHYTQLPEVFGFTRIPDHEYAPGKFRRMLRCNACRDEIPSLGVGYHKQGKSVGGLPPCVERKARRSK
jgi:hypothetical protein